MKIIKRIYFLLFTSFFTAGEVHASIQLNGTRIIYPADEREVSFSMVNNGGEARLIQSWVDTGNVQEKPDNSSAPFIITPPMVRVDAGKGQTLRIIFTGKSMPQDRESIFWLNVLEIPPKPNLSEEEKSYVQMAVRSRIKIFYRPKGLGGGVESSAEKITWKIKTSGAQSILSCTNNTPYNVSFSDISLKNAPSNRNVSKGGMCPAKGVADFTVNGDVSKAEGKLIMTTINDYGAFKTIETSFSK